MKIKLLFAFFIPFGMEAYSQNWTPAGAGMDGPIYSLIVFNGELYAGGNFDTAGGNSANYIAQWNGSNWSSVGGGMDNPVACFTIHNSELYAGGYFTGGIARWDGSNWQPVGSGVAGTVTSLKSYAGELYAGGTFTSPCSRIAKWNGGNWIPVGSGMDGDVVTLAVFSGELYAGGAFNTPSQNIAKWNGSNWSGIGNANSQADALEPDGIGNALYVGGTFDQVSGSVSAKKIAKWNGISWSPLGLGIDDPSTSYVLALKTGLNNELYAGGKFLQAGGLPVANIAKWDGLSWSAVDVGMNGEVYALAIYNGELYAGGDFTTAGGNQANFIAKVSVPTGIIESNDSYETLQVYPNPVSRNEPIHFEGDCRNDCVVTIYDCLGVEVSRLDLDMDRELQLDLSSGVYLYKFKDHTGKILVK